MNLLALSPYLSAFIIFALRMTDVSLGTVRMIMVIHGRSVFAALIGFVEISIFIFAIAGVISNLGNWWNMLGYSGGFALGTFLGMKIESRIMPGFTHIRVISLKKGAALAKALRKKGFGVTEMRGRGIHGHNQVVTTLVGRREVKEVIDTIKAIDSEAFITVDESRVHYRGFFRLKRK